MGRLTIVESDESHSPDSSQVAKKARRGEPPPNPPVDTGGGGAPRITKGGVSDESGVFFDETAAGL